MSYDTTSAVGPSAQRARLATYYALLVTQTISLIGSQISEYAVSIAVFRATGHATPLALVAFFATVPAIVLGGFGGALADRFDRRAMMLIASGGFIVVNSLLLASFAAGTFQIWQLYAATLFVSLFGALARPAFMASVATLVPDSQRDRANAFGQLSGSAAGVIAPAAAGLLYALIGVVGSIAINIAAFFIGLAVLLVVRIPKPPQTADGQAMQSSVLRQMFDGFRYLWARRALFWFCGYISIVNLVANTVMVLLTPYALTRTGSTALMGAVLAAMNGGGIAGALAISAGAKFGSRMETVMLGLAGAAVFMSLVGVGREPIMIGGSLFGMMFALSFSNAPFWSMLQAKIAPDLQGRVFSAYLQGVMLMSPIAFVVAGPLADRVFEPARRLPAWHSVGWLVGSGPGAGMGLMFVVAGVLILLLSLAVAAVPAVRRLESDLPDHTVADARDG